MEASDPRKIQIIFESCMEFDGPLLKLSVDVSLFDHQIPPSQKIEGLNGETMQLTVKTGSQTEMIDITASIEDVVRKSGLEEGLCFVFVPHTTAAVTINESADPSVKADMLKVINQVIPWEAGYRHMEGNSPAHIKSTLVGASESIAVEKGRLVLGTWQGVFFCEFDGPRTRKVNVNLFPSGK